MLLASSAVCAHHAVFFAWAHTAPPDTYNDHYEKWFYVYGILILVQPLIAAAVIYLLRRKDKTA